MFAVAYFAMLSLYSIVFILISDSNKYQMVSGLLLFCYSISCLYVVGNRTYVFNLSRFLKAYFVILNDVTVILTCGMLFSKWQWTLTVTVGLFLWSILFFAMEYHYIDSNEKLVVETIETYRKRITFLEID